MPLIVDKFLLVVTNILPKHFSGEKVFLSRDLKEQGLSNNLHFLNIKPEKFNSEVEIHKLIFDKVSCYRLQLKEILADIHGISVSSKASAIMLDSWLLHFFSVIYDRSNRIAQANKKTSNSFFIDRCDLFNVPMSTKEFVQASGSSDEFNQFLYVAIAKNLDIEVRNISESFFSFPDPKEVQAKNTADTLKFKFFEFYLRIIKPCLLIDSWLGASPKKITLRSLGRIFFIPVSFLPDIKSKNVNRNVRELLRVDEHDNYDKIFNELAPLCFPMSLLENFNQYYADIKYVAKVKIIGSQTGFYFDDEYKILAARVIENGGKVLGFQHGGNYNIYKHFFGEIFEVINSDKYYHWGTRSKTNKALVAGKMESLQHINLNKNNSKIMFVINGLLRYEIREEGDNNKKELDHVARIQRQFVFYETLENS